MSELLSTDPRALAEYDEICALVARGELCGMDGKECELVTYHERYGEDADGNRGMWVEYRRCRKCGEELHD